MITRKERKQQQKIANRRKAFIKRRNIKRQER